MKRIWRWVVMRMGMRMRTEDLDLTRLWFRCCASQGKITRWRRTR